MNEDAILGFIALFEAGNADVVFVSTVNDIAEALGGQRCVSPHGTDVNTALIYLLALIARDRMASN